MTWVPTEQADSQKLSRVGSSNGWKVVQHKKNRIISLGSSSMPDTENMFSPLILSGEGVCGELTGPAEIVLPISNGSSFAGIPDSGRSFVVDLLAGQGVYPDAFSSLVVEPEHTVTDLLSLGCRPVMIVADPPLSAPIECASEVPTEMVGFLPLNAENELVNGGAGQGVGTLSDFKPISDNPREGYVPGDLIEEQDMADSFVQKQLAPDESRNGDLLIRNGGPVVDRLALIFGSIEPVLCQVLEYPHLPSLSCTHSRSIDPLIRMGEPDVNNGGLLAFEPNSSWQDDSTGNGMDSDVSGQVDLPIEKLDETTSPLLNLASVCIPGEQAHESSLATFSTLGPPPLNQHTPNSSFLEAQESNTLASSTLGPTPLTLSQPNPTLTKPNPPLAQPNLGLPQTKPIPNPIPSQTLLSNHNVIPKHVHPAQPITPSPTLLPNTNPSQHEPQQPANMITQFSQAIETEQDSPFPPSFSPNPKEMAELRNLLIDCASGIPKEHRKDYVECMKNFDDADILEFYRDRLGSHHLFGMKRVILRIRHCKKIRWRSGRKPKKIQTT